MLMILIQVIFWLCIFLVVYSYVVYPLILLALARNVKANNIIYSHDTELPHIDILLSVYNEEKVIREKIESVFNTDYPLDKIHFYIGSDESDDATEEIILEYSNRFPQIKFKRFSKTGKIGIINQLVQKLSSSSILVLTDANVFFEKSTLINLVRHFKNEKIGVVGGNIFFRKKEGRGISTQESFYQNSENRIKYLEGLWGGVMMGAFGGCYVIRKDCFKEVPSNYLVDDFFITLECIKKGYSSILARDAIAIEDASTKITEEFRRKVRISAGNFQNLKTFRNLLWPPYKKVAIAFFSHKAIRWISPFLMISSFVFNLFLLDFNPFYKLTMIGQLILMGIPILDWVLEKNDINFKLLRFVTHFYGMNLALLVGFVRFLMGIKTNIWKPTERNQ